MLKKFMGSFGPLLWVVRVKKLEHHHRLLLVLLQETNAIQTCFEELEGPGHMGKGRGLRWAKSRDSYRRIASESYCCDSNR